MSACSIYLVFEECVADVAIYSLSVIPNQSSLEPGVDDFELGIVERPVDIFEDKLAVLSDGLRINICLNLSENRKNYISCSLRIGPGNNAIEGSVDHDPELPNRLFMLQICMLAFLEIQAFWRFVVDLYFVQPFRGDDPSRRRQQNYLPGA